MSGDVPEIYISDSLIILPDVNNKSIIYIKETRKISGGIIDRLELELIAAQGKIAMLEKLLELS
jgi:hypothetical protein